MPNGSALAEPATRSWGQGRIARLLAHCTLGSSSGWRGVMEELSGAESGVGLDGISITFDLPGHGRSADLPDAADMHDVATEWATGLLPPEGQVDLIGHSFGATVMLRLALERPEAVRRLVLIEPPYFAALRGTPAWEDYLAQESTTDAALQSQDAESAARGFTACWGDGTPWDELPLRQRQAMTRRIGLVSRQSSAIRDDLRGVMRPGRLEALDLPVLLLEGAQSPPAAAAVQARLAERLPNAERQIVEGAGHMLPLTHPAEVAGRIARFLS